MSDWILVFNQNPIEKINCESLLKAVTASNFGTLCHQYDLDTGLIQPAMQNLEILQTDGTTPFVYLLRYRPKGQCPLRVYRWGVNEETGRALLTQALTEADLAAVRKALSKTVQIMGIELKKEQLEDLGLLLGYELARWAADQGGGILRGLDGIWYRLNRHAAFIPMDE